jgi:hypothetical protein
MIYSNSILVQIIDIASHCAQAIKKIMLFIPFGPFCMDRAYRDVPGTLHLLDKVFYLTLLTFRVHADFNATSALAT